MTNRAKGKRIAAVAGELNTAERIKAALAAVRADDRDGLKFLHQTAPRKTYTQCDAQLTDTLDAAESVGLRVDRGFYEALARRWRGTFFVLGRRDRELDLDDDEHFAEACAAIADMMAMVRGAEITADRLGFDLEELLAFSAAAGSADWKSIAERVADADAEMKAGLEALAEVFAEAMLTIWREAGGKAAA